MTIQRPDDTDGLDDVVALLGAMVLCVAIMAAAGVAWFAICLLPGLIGIGG